MAEPDEISGFEYFMVGVVPVAVPLSVKQERMGTMVPNPKTRMLEIDMRFLDDVSNMGYEVTRLDKDAFDAACEAYYRKNAK